MINRNVKFYCCEDISLIENYEEAKNDTTQIWHCHHRLETDLNLSKQELIDTERYWNIEAKYLIFLTERDHYILHFKGKHLSDKHKRKLSAFFKGRHYSKDIKEKMRKPKPKHKWLTPDGEIKIMNTATVKRFHPDWKLIEEEN